MLHVGCMREFADITHEMWTFIKLRSQKKNFRAPDGDVTRNRLMAGEML